MSRTHEESFLKTSLQASTVHMQAVAIARHMLGIYNTFSPPPHSFCLITPQTARSTPDRMLTVHRIRALIQHRYGRIKDANINGESHGENAKASRIQTSRCSRQLTHPKHFKKHYETPDSCSWLEKKNGEGTFCSLEHTAGYGNKSLSQHTHARLSACRNRQVTEMKMNYKDDPKWVSLLRHWKSFNTSRL